MSDRVYQGDVLQTLRRLPTASFDAVLSDPPYGLEFLGLDWDKVLLSTDVWRELLRVLKPSAPALIFGGAKTFHRLFVSLEDAGFEVVDTLMWVHAQGLPKSHALPKPAFEPIALVRAPGDRVRPLNIDGCRIGSGDGGARAGEASAERRYAESGTTSFAMKPGPRGGSVKGRWPANIILDDVSAALLDEQSGNRPGMSGGGKHRASYKGGMFGGIDSGSTARGDSGCASRFFFCTKVRGEDRVHPTQKPIDLARWCATMLYVPNGSILIPYAGVGSEMVGAARAGWANVVGIEQNREYALAAMRRVDEERKAA